MRCLLLSAAPAVFALLSASAPAQIVEAYGTISVNHLANVELLPYNSNLYSSYTPAGGTFGATLNFVPLHVVSIGLDARETVARGANFWLAGLQIKAKPPLLPIKPYFRLSVGEAHLKVPQTASSSIPNPAPVDLYIYNAGLGVDYHLLPFVDLRLLEIGDGRTLGAGSKNPTNLLTINSGIVVHF